jgi:hypothetical protein
MKHAVACIYFLLAVSLHAQELFNNETILKLVKAGIGEATIVGMVNQQPGNYALSADDMIALKRAGVSDRLIAAMVVRNGGSNAQPIQSGGNGFAATALVTPPAGQGPLILHDATPIRLGLNRNLSSEDAKAGDSVDFEVLDDLKIDDVVVVARGGTAIATVTQAEAKKRMARGGKLDVNIDYVRLVNGDKVAVRAVKEAKGGGHTGAMTGGMVATAIVFFPAAPFFLFMHGKDVTIPKGTEITAYVDGEIKLDRARFLAGASPQPTIAQQPTVAVSTAPAPPATAASLFDVTFTSTPSSALVTINRQPIGRTPFITKLPPGIYKAVFSVNGYATVSNDVAVGVGFPTTVDTTLRALQ